MAGAKSPTPRSLSSSGLSEGRGDVRSRPCCAHAIFRVLAIANAERTAGEARCRCVFVPAIQVGRGKTCSYLLRGCSCVAGAACGLSGRWHRQLHRNFDAPGRDAANDARAADARLSDAADRDEFRHLRHAAENPPSALASVFGQTAPLARRRCGDRCASSTARSLMGAPRSSRRPPVRRPTAAAPVRRCRSCRRARDRRFP